MTITINKVVEEQVKLTPPLFWRNPMSDNLIDYTALLDEKTACNVFISNGLAIVKNCDPHYANVQECYNKWQPITEDQFFEALNKAVEKVSLMPVLTEKL